MCVSEWVYDFMYLAETLVENDARARTGTINAMVILNASIETRCWSMGSQADSSWISVNPGRASVCAKHGDAL